MNLAYNGALGARTLLLSGCVAMRLEALGEWEGERWVSLSDLGLLWKQLVMLASGSLPPFLGEGCGFSSFMFFIQKIVIYVSSMMINGEDYRRLAKCSCVPSIRARSAWAWWLFQACMGNNRWALWCAILPLLRRIGNEHRIWLWCDSSIS